MLYLFYGKNTFNSRKHLRDVVSGLLKKSPSSGVYRFYPEDTDEETLAGLAGDGDLFGAKHIVILDKILDDPKMAKHVFSRLESIKNSKNIFLWFEEKIDSQTLSKLKKYSVKAQEFKEPSQFEFKKWIKKESDIRNIKITYGEINKLADSLNYEPWAVHNFLEMKSLGGEDALDEFSYNHFRATDLFFSGKIREAYAEFLKNIENGVGAEEMFWGFWWQARTFFAVSMLQNRGLDHKRIQSITGFKPFVVKKNLGYIQKNGTEKSPEYIHGLFNLWNGSRVGSLDLRLGLERFLLG